MNKRVFSFAIGLGLLAFGVLAPGCTEIPESRESYGLQGDGGSSAGTGGRASGGSPDGGPGAGGRGSGGRGAGGGLPEGGGVCDPDECPGAVVGGTALPACCGGANGDECGIDIAATGVDRCVPTDNPGGYSPDCTSRVVEGETVAGCCREGSSTCGLVLDVPGLDLGCVDPVDLGLLPGGPCNLDPCPPPGDPCETNDDCCGGPGVASCVTFGSDTQGSCTKYCTTNEECDTNCCAPLTNGKGSCALDATFCSAECRVVGESCDAEGDCCSEATCVDYTENRGPKICRPRCSDAIPCPSGEQCVAGACIEDTVVLCTNTCRYAGDGECDEGSGLCTYGTDCTDCEPHRGGTAICDDSCTTASNGVCGDGGSGATNAVCTWGTDCTDCGPRLGVCANTCRWAQDGECDEGTGVCPEGTDCWDCGFFFGGRGQVPCDGTTAGFCTADGSSLDTPGRCDCPDCAWDQADCGGANRCDGRTISACCGPSNPCGIDGDGYCDCGGFCPWEASDCSPDEPPPPAECDPTMSSGCDACLQDACCTEWLACDRNCAADFGCIQDCVATGTDAELCFDTCAPAAGGTISPATSALILCSLGGTEGGPAPCAECFQFGGVSPDPASP